MQKNKNFKSPKFPGFKALWEIFWFLQIITWIGFGGGNALMPIIRRYAVLKYKWITEEQYEQAVVVANMLPGPSVVQMLCYISSVRIGKFWGISFTIIAILPHVLFAVLLFYGFSFLPKQYLLVINIGVLCVIVSTLIFFAWRYLKMSHKELSMPLWVGLFLFTLFFALFVPAPYNIPAIIMVAVIIIVFVYEYRRSKKLKTKSNSDLEHGAK